MITARISDALYTWERTSLGSAKCTVSAVACLMIWCSCQNTTLAKHVPDSNCQFSEIVKFICSEMLWPVTSTAPANDLFDSVGESTLHLTCQHLVAAVVCMWCCLKACLIKSLCLKVDVFIVDRLWTWTVCKLQLLFLLTVKLFSPCNNKFI